MIRHLLDMLGFSSAAVRDADSYRNLIRREAVLGGQVFGQIPQGHRREFFCLDETTWIWHEEWTDTSGTRQVKNTRYEVRPDGILKAQNGGTYRKVSGVEACNLYDAAKIYQSQVVEPLYQAA
jgi:hypothetical protein